MRSLRISFFGSSLVSAYWNGAATYYRGILRALAQRGHDITFYEPDAYDRQAHRDIADPPWATVKVYSANSVHARLRALAEAAGSDLLVKASGVGVHDGWLERHVLKLRSRRTRVVFWDVDAPATLDRLGQDLRDPFHTLIPQYDLVFTYGGGPPVVVGYGARGARRTVPIYNALDPDTHLPAPPDPRFAGDVGFLGNRLPDREARVQAFFFDVAARLPHLTFVLGGSGWDSRLLPPNVRYVGHVYTHQHSAFFASTRVTVNIHRESMARMGYSPATRIFEAAGAGACILSDSFIGAERFLRPGEEILLCEDSEALAQILSTLSPDRARSIGRRARARVLAEHTYRHRAEDVEAALAPLWPLDLPMGEAGLGETPALEERS